MKRVLERKRMLEATILRRGTTLTYLEGVATEMSHGKTRLKQQEVTKHRMGDMWFSSSKCEKDAGG